jgi:N-acetylmuramoyl-L-alanine amidase
MPSILIETGFLTNREEEKYLNSEKGQQEISLSVLQAIKNYKAEVENDYRQLYPNSDDQKPMIADTSQKLYAAAQTNADTTIDSSKDAVIDSTKKAVIAAAAVSQVIYKVQIAASEKNISP